MADDALLERYHDLLNYEYRLVEAEEDLLAFCQVSMADRRKLDDPFDSLFSVQPHHRLIARIMDRFETEPGYNFCLSLPPRHGKTEIAIRRYTAWRMARRPHEDMALFAYNQEKAEDYGREVSAIISHPRFRQVFPDFAWKKDTSEIKETMHAGNLYLVGRGGTINGRGFHRGLADDPIKNADEARRPLIRDQLWQWFLKDVWTRRHHDGCNVGVIQTRWHADDLIGRISDPANPYYVESFHHQFDVINVPALATGDYDPLDRKEGEALWPERHGAAGLRVRQATDPVGFSCLYQGNPIPDDGVLIRDEHIFTYDQMEFDEVKDDLRVYVTADFATGTTKQHDKSCLMPVGVGKNGVIYVLPGIFWGRKSAEALVEELIRICKVYKPLTVYPEGGHIWKTMAPFVEKRLSEEGVYYPLKPVWPTRRATGSTASTAKVERIVSAHARMAAGQIKFPAFAPWWPNARTEMLQFPNGANDDFVDALALVGLQVDRLVEPGSGKKRVAKVEPYTWDWLMRDDSAPNSDGWMTGR